MSPSVIFPITPRDELASRAAKSGRSLQQYLHQQLTDLAARPDMDALLAEIRRTGVHLLAVIVRRGGRVGGPNRRLALLSRALCLLGIMELS